jgi:protocatechuate 3,4-dioxygenase beta subunit
MTLNRRNLLKRLGTGTIIGATAIKALASDTCNFLTTPEQPLGPFYPNTLPLDTNADLTKISGRSIKALGEVIIVKGIVQDENCKPIKGAIVEIWQACKSGKYNHASDTSGNSLDPNFQYYGTVKTNNKGEYLFKTILPGAYDANATWTRPPHIHYKVSLRGYEELVTQLYFKGDKLNENDRILQGLNRDEKDEVIIEFKKGDTSKHRLGVFNIKLQSL